METLEKKNNETRHLVSGEVFSLNILLREPVTR